MFANALTAQHCAQPHKQVMGAGAGHKCTDAQRTVPAGGLVSGLLLHPSITPFQKIFRKLPSDAVYSSTKSNLFTFEIGSYTVPESMALAVAEYSFRPYRLSGALAGEPIPLEDGRLAMSLTYDINFSQYRSGNITTEVYPQLPRTQQAAFAGVPNPAPMFPGVGATNPWSGQVISLYGGGTAPASGSGSDPIFQFNSDPRTQLTTIGSGGLPTSAGGQQGPSRFPFTFYAKANQAVQLKVTVGGPINIPLAFFEAKLSGYLMPANTLEAMLDGVAPCL
jgi:hypothetical protein